MKIITTRIKGLGEGKKLGFPTINLKIPPSFALPPGVYVCRLNGLPGALFYGERLTHRVPGMSLEVFLIDSSNLIDGLNFLRKKRSLTLDNSHSFELEIGQKIRNNKQFSSLAALKKQIGQDVQKIKILLQAE